MRRIAAFVLLLSLLFTLCACSLAINQPQAGTNHNSTLLSPLALPKISSATVVLSHGISSTRFSAETLPSASQSNDTTCVLYITPNVPATITNAEGQVLELRQGATSGTMEVLGYMPILSGPDAPPLCKYYVAPSESFTYIRQDGALDYTEFTASGPDLYGSAYGTGIQMAHISPQGVQVEGAEMDATACTASGCPDEYYFQSVISGESRFDLVSPLENDGASATTTDGTATVSIISNKTAMAVAEFGIDPAQTRVLFNTWDEALDGTHAPTEPTMTPEEMEEARKSAVWLYLDPNVPATIHNAEHQFLQIDAGELSGDMVILDYKPEVTYRGISRLCGVLVVNSERFLYSRQDDVSGQTCFMVAGPALYAGAYGHGLGMVSVLPQDILVIGPEMKATVYTSDRCPEGFYLNANLSKEQYFLLSCTEDGTVTAKTDAGQAEVCVRSEKLLLPVAKYQLSSKETQELFSSWDGIRSAAAWQGWLSVAALLVVLVLVVLLVLRFTRRKKAMMPQQDTTTPDCSHGI